MPKKILIVDDNKDLTLEMSYLLYGADIEAYRAANGWQALDALEDIKPDLIISDINMPGMDGYQLCKKLKEAGLLQRIPVIILTGYSTRINEFKNLGIQEFLMKPFEGGRLLSAIERVFQKQ